MRTRAAQSLAFGLLLALLATATAEANPPDAQALALLRQDAELSDVCFVDAQHGWAVGDRGVIWHTRDGGKNWQQQESPVTCRLNSVHFIDARHGWAAGGATTQFTHVPQGVVLVTRDGGEKWSSLPRLLVPTFQRIKFFDNRQGVAFGAPSSLFPSGVFTTEDGGRSWTTVPSDEGQYWLAGDFVDPLTGALASRGAAPAVVRRRTIAPAQTGPLGLRSLRAMQLIAPTSGWLVGDGGLIMTTADLGRTWQTAAGELPGGAGEYFDLHTVAVEGQTVWVAGTPGTRVFRSTDGGQTWTAHDTGSQVPISQLTFVDAQRGWAVGALGTILATSDGGETWQRQRAGGSRAAMLGVFSEPRQIPLELFAHLSAGQGYLGVVELLGRRDLDEQAGVRDDVVQRAHDAVVEVGACGVEAAWRFPLRQPGLGLSVDQLVAGLDRANDGRAVEKLETHIVRAIRIWKPEIIITHHASARGEMPLEHLVNQIVLRAVEKASDPTSYVELSTIAGLPPWQPRKVFSTVPWGESGTLSINTVQLEPRLGRSVGDKAGEARGLVVERFEPAPVEVGFRLLLDRVPQDRGREDFFSGVSLSPGGDARRMLSEPLNETIEQLRRVAQKRRNMQELIRRGEEGGALDTVWSGQLNDLTSGLDQSSAAQLLYQLAGQYLQQGNWEMASGTYEMLVEKHPLHPLAHSAQIWLLQYHASGEAAWRMRQQSSFTTQHSVGRLPPTSSGVVPASAHLPLRSNAGLVQDRTKGNSPDQRFEYASHLGKQMERTVPTLFAQPSVGFPLASAHRKLGYGNQASRYYMSLRRTRTQDAWWAAAQGERWLEERNPFPPKPIWTVPQVAHKPHLDGQFDEPFWAHAKPVELKSILKDDRTWPAVARMAYDRQFLYLAIECRKAVGARYDSSNPPRPRDADLEPHDRVSLLIDIDRDYVTYYQLTVDHRGWTYDACWGDATWNPTWYVAHASTSESWSIEAAIPLAELTGITPEKGHVWAVGLQRTVPGVGFQSWTHPAGTKVMPEGFGYLMFE